MPAWIRTKPPADESGGRSPNETLSETDQPIFECAELSVRLSRPGHENFEVVHDVSFAVRPGEFVSLLGPSGSGKTTILRVLAGLIGAAPGSTVRFRGAPVVGPPKDVVLVFQDYVAALLPWRTVARNAALGVEERLPRAERHERVTEALTMVGLEDRAEDYPRHLSGGMRQRLQIARALVMRPQVLLMDEPFGALDAMTKAGLQDDLQRLQAKTGMTIVFVTHDIDEAIYLSDRVIVLNGDPAGVRRSLDVGLSRPRTQTGTRDDTEFVRLRNAVYDAVAGEET